MALHNDSTTHKGKKLQIHDIKVFPAQRYGDM